MDHDTVEEMRARRGFAFDDDVRRDAMVKRRFLRIVLTNRIARTPMHGEGHEWTFLNALLLIGFGAFVVFKTRIISPLVS